MNESPVPKLDFGRLKRARRRHRSRSRSRRSHRSAARAPETPLGSNRRSRSLSRSRTRRHHHRRQTRSLPASARAHRNTATPRVTHSDRSHWRRQPVELADLFDFLKNKKPLQNAGAATDRTHARKHRSKHVHHSRGYSSHRGERRLSHSHSHRSSAHKSKKAKKSKKSATKKKVKPVKRVPMAVLEDHNSINAVQRGFVRSKNSCTSLAAKPLDADSKLELPPLTRRPTIRNIFRLAINRQSKNVLLSAQADENDFFSRQTALALAQNVKFTQPATRCELERTLSPIAPIVAVQQTSNRRTLRTMR